MADTKIGAYICKGCGLGERLDCDDLATIAKRDGKAQVVQQHDFLCSEDGVKMIQNDIDNEGVNRVVIAACSRRAKNEAFNFENVTIARANLREGVIWIRPDEDDMRETTQEMAADYIRMSCVESKFLTPPASAQEKGSNGTVLVAGGNGRAPAAPPPRPPPPPATEPAEPPRPPARPGPGRTRSRRTRNDDVS